MDDIEQFIRLIKGGDSCISIVTFEEHYALEIIRNTVLDLKRDMFIWSISSGVRDGLLAESPFVADTETPASGLKYLTETKDGSICVTLDIAEHVKSGLALRAIRDLIDCFEKKGNTLVMITHEPDMATYCERIIHLKDGLVQREERL